MKRCLLFGLVISVLANMCFSAARGAEEARDELLKNPGFDELDAKGKPVAWSISPQAAFWREKAYLSKDYELVSRPGAYVLATQRLALKPGQQYTLTFQMKGEGGGLGGALLLHGAERPTREMPIVWNLESSAQYEPYVSTFVAPDPACALYLYNVARKGTVCYDHVSLRSGPPDRPFVSTLSLKPIDRPVGTRPATRHIPWARPLAGGPIKTLITLRTFLCSNDVAELGQRLDLDADVLHTGYQGDESISETGRRINRRLDSAEYAVYLVASRTGEVLAKTIRQRIEAGAGLVVLEGFGQGSRYAKKEWREAPADHPLRQVIALEAMPEKILAKIETAEIGKGRAVRLTFPIDRARVWGLLPSENSLEAYKQRQFEYWEWWHALLARAIAWAAGRDAGVQIGIAASKEEKDGWVALQIDRAPSDARASVQFRSSREIRFDGPLLRLANQDLPIPRDGRLSIALPAQLPAGDVLADVVIRDGQGGALAWKSIVIPTPQQARLTEVRVDRDAYGRGDQVGVLWWAVASKPVEAVFETRLIDAFGRVVARQQRTGRLGPETQGLVSILNLEDPQCVHHRAEVRLLVAGREQDRGWVDVFVPEVGPQKAGADFTATAWSPGMTHPMALAQFAARTRKLGFNAEFASSLYAAAEHGMPCGGYLEPPGGVFRQEKPSPGGVRPKCLSNPAVVDDYKAKAREVAARQKPFGMYAAGITDEAFLTSRHQRDEVCFSPHCQARYRQWLQKRYQALEKLNAQWETAYKSWDEIRGARTEDVRGQKNFAPFVDFRTFMAEVWIDACRQVTSAYHEVAPSTPIGHTNTFGADPFSGNDFWKLAAEVGFGWGQEYSEAIKPQGQKAIFELWRSFVETPQARVTRAPDGKPDSAAPFFNYGWIGYDHRVAAAHYEPWWLALHGARGLSWYAVNSMDPRRGTSWSLVYPTLEYTPYSAAVEEGLKDLRSGCGKLLMEYQRAASPIAVLWSYPSMLVAWCEAKTDEPEPTETPGCDSYGTHFRSAVAFRHHVDDLQLGCDYVAPEQIAADPAVLGRYRMLMLPFTVAISRPLVARLKEYVAGGGVLVADLRGLRTDEHGSPFGESQPLEELFGVRRAGETVAYGATEVTFTTAGEGIDLRGRSIATHGRESLALTKAKALATHAKGEPAVTANRIGKGLAIYFNFCLPLEGDDARLLVEQCVRRAGIERSFRVEAANRSGLPRCYEANSFQRGPVSLHAVIRDHRRCEDTDAVQVRFPAAAHLYDIRAGRYLGHTDRTEATLPPGETAFYARLPYRVSAINLSASPAVAGAALRATVDLSADGAGCGDHVFHVEIIGPDGQPREHYARNLLAPAGRCQVSIPLALGDPRGKWTIRVRDVLSGHRSEAVVVVSPPGE